MSSLLELPGDWITIPVSEVGSDTDVYPLIGPSSTFLVATSGALFSNKSR
jgi:hypothetical protein